MSEIGVGVCTHCPGWTSIDPRWSTSTATGELTLPWNVLGAALQRSCVVTYTAGLATSATT